MDTSRTQKDTDVGWAWNPDGGVLVRPAPESPHGLTRAERLAARARLPRKLRKRLQRERKAGRLPNGEKLR